MHVKCLSIGFTLIELMIVVAIFAFMGGLVMVTTGHINRSLIRTDINHITALCKHAQYKAMMNGKPVIIQCSSAGNSYSCEQSMHQLTNGVCFGTVTEAKGPPSAPTKPITNPITFERESITFTPDGMMQSGALYLVDAKKQVMYAVTNGVSAVSFLRIYQYDGQQHAWKEIR